MDFNKISIETVPISQGLYLLVAVGGNMGNVGVSVGSDGVLLVDDQFAPMYPKILEALGKLSKQPVRFVVNSHFHGDTIGSNELMAKAGAVIIAHDNARKRLIAQRSLAVPDPRNPAVPDGALPTLTFSDTLSFHFNGEEIDVIHIGPGHTDADSVVYFRKANVLHAGDLFDTGRYPIIILEHGGSANGLIAAQERILKMVNKDTKILPGKGGPITNMKDVQEQHDMIVTVRDRVLNGIRAGKTLEQVLASKPTAEFDDSLKIGRGPGDFVTLIYQELSKK